MNRLHLITRWGRMGESDSLNHELGRPGQTAGSLNGSVLLAIAMRVAHALGAYQGRRRLSGQRRMKALLLTKAGAESQAATQRRMKVVALGKAGADKAD